MVTRGRVPPLIFLSWKKLHSLMSNIQYSGIGEEEKGILIYFILLRGDPPRVWWATRIGGLRKIIEIYTLFCLSFPKPVGLPCKKRSLEIFFLFLFFRGAPCPKGDGRLRINFFYVNCLGRVTALDNKGITV